MSNDSISVDSVLLQQLQADERYEYSRDLLQVDRESVLSWLMRTLRRWMNELFNSEPMENMGEWLWPVVAVVLLAAVAAFLYWRRHSLFGSARTVENHDADAIEDTIYGIDFPSAIAAAQSQRQWNEVVRLVYLQTLKVLTDANRIQWRPYKTPSQYLHEVTSDDFRVFTHHFLRVRYGGFPADEALCQAMVALQRAIEKGGETDER